MTRATIFRIRHPGDGLVQAPHEPGEVDQALAPGGDELLEADLALPGLP